MNELVFYSEDSMLGNVRICNILEGWLLTVIKSFVSNKLVVLYNDYNVVIVADNQSNNNE